MQKYSLHVRRVDQACWTRLPKFDNPLYQPGIWNAQIHCWLSPYRREEGWCRPCLQPPFDDHVNTRWQCMWIELYLDIENEILQEKKERVALLKKSGTHCEFCKLTSGSFDNNKRFCCWQTFLPNLWRVLLFLRIAEEVISFLCLMWINYMDALNQDLREIQQWQSWRMPVHQWERALSTANA